MKYIDRDGKKKDSCTGQDRFLAAVYGRTGGRLLIKPLLLPVVSKAVGTFLDSRCSCPLVPLFIRMNPIDMTDYVQRKYHSFNDFFTRELKEGRRAVDARENCLISPCDGKVSAYETGSRGVFNIKQTVYSLESLLRDRKLAEKYKDGYVVILRLSVDDYHRYVYPVSGRKSRNRFIPGILHTVNPAACEQIPVYKENAREYTMIRTEEFGDVLQMEVGALMVGRICNYQNQGTVAKGMEKGRFEFGGSTIILMLEKEKVRLAGDFLENTKRGYETQIHLGEALALKR